MNFRLNTTTERIENTAGLIFAGSISKKIDLHLPKINLIPNKEVIRCMFGLFIQGRTSYEEIAIYRNSSIFKKSFDLCYVPAKETLRLYIKKIASFKKLIQKVLLNVNLNLLKEVSFTPVSIGKYEYVPIDIDVSPMNNSRTEKEGVGRTYKGFDGFAPIFSYIGSEGYMLDCELRPGKQHCQKNTPQYLQRGIEQLKKLNSSHPFLFRLDGGNDSFDTLKVLIDSSHFFLIKRNKRKESNHYWLDIARSIGTADTPREGKTVYTGVLTKSHPKATKDTPDLDIVFKITERTITHDGNLLLIPEIEVETYWTNLYENPEVIIALYHDHGTSEQFHSELKTDMDVERFPSRDFAVNSLILQIAMIAFNALRYIGQSALRHGELLPVKPTVKRKRLRKVISDLINVACKLVTHSREYIIRIWKDNPWAKVFLELHKQFQTV